MQTIYYRLDLVIGICLCVAIVVYLITVFSIAIYENWWSGKEVKKYWRRVINGIKYKFNLWWSSHRRHNTNGK